MSSRHDALPAASPSADDDRRTWDTNVGSSGTASRRLISAGGMCGLAEVWVNPWRPPAAPPALLAEPNALMRGGGAIVGTMPAASAFSGPTTTNPQRCPAEQKSDPAACRQCPAPAFRLARDPGICRRRAPQFCDSAESRDFHASACSRPPEPRGGCSCPSVLANPRAGTQKRTGPFPHRECPFP